MTTPKVNIKSGSPDRFGHSWHIFNEILPIHEVQFNRWSQGLSKDDWKGKHFLDVGCGIGRNSYWPFVYGAKSASCIDVDERTLDAARKNLQSYPKADIKFQSIYDLNISNEYDICFSIGVIHHLEKPALAVQKMVAAAKPGGVVFVWLYGYENNEWIVKYFNPLRSVLFSRLPLSLVYACSLPLTAVLWLLLKSGFGKTDYFKFIKTVSFKHLRAIVYDHMIPQIANYYKKEEALNLLKETGLENVEIYWVNQMSWTVIGHKPLE
jgi:SAM-dependent methyltransferase